MKKPPDGSSLEKFDHVVTTGSIDNDVSKLEGSDFIATRDGSDYVYGGKGKDLIVADAGNDFVAGNAGADQIYGKSGKDALKGGKGDDLLVWGRGADIFVESQGVDIIQDFSLQQGDRIGLDNDSTCQVIDGSDGLTIKIGDAKEFLLLDQDYQEFLAAGDDAIVRI